MPIYIIEAEDGGLGPILLEHSETIPFDDFCRMEQAARLAVHDALTKQIYTEGGYYPSFGANMESIVRELETLHGFSRIEPVRISRPPTDPLLGLAEQEYFGVQNWIRSEKPKRNSI